MSATAPAIPIPMLLWCPACRARHIDTGAFATKPHHTHACQWCGMVWRPALVATVGVDFLPGFKDADRPAEPCGCPPGGWSSTCPVHGFPGGRPPR